MPVDPPRCFDSNVDPLRLRYHDDEWGTPLHDDDGLFEFLVLSGFQAGLNWMTILRKREAFWEAFDGFEIALVASYGPRERERLLSDARIIRNRAKIGAAITNAQRALEVRQAFGSFSKYLWGFTGGKSLRRPGLITRESRIATSPESDAMARELKKRGFKFAGSTICYAFMQSTGMVNDHLDGCFKALS